MSSAYASNYKKIAWNQRPEVNRSRRTVPVQRVHLLSDIQAFVSPIDQQVISSRSQLRDHERQHNVRQVGNDWAGSERPKNWEVINGTN